MSDQKKNKFTTSAMIACTISAAMILSMASNAIAASSPDFVDNSNNVTASAFKSVNDQLRSLSAKELKEKFTLRNAKGEVVLLKSQRAKEKGTWATLDAKIDGIQGTSTEKVYKTFNVPATKNEVIVAVIDSGVDISHEDLRGKIWVNKGEIPGNGIDDDGDGYIDDINGWNFLGNSKGENIAATTLEITREYSRMLKKAEAGALSTEEQAYLTKVKGMYEKEAGNTTQQYKIITQVIAAYKLLKANGLKEETVEAIAALQSTDAAVLEAKELATSALKQGFDSATSQEYSDELKVKAEYYYNLDFDSSVLVGDNPSVLDEKGYGNPNVTGPDSMHGTHVAGIIAAARNALGIDGQARNVKIMSIRAVPDGDERDKDVANAIRFAVDHGARVINMSFGKPLSPQKAYVDAAMKYAESKNVLLVHAAGNDGKNTESYDNNFPNKKTIADTGTRDIETWIEVGASSRKNDATLPASFSNWGKTSVDLFAPGVDIVSTVPGNKYRSLQGTSMASPEVAGVAALLLNIYPFATAQELKNAMMTTTTQYEGLQVSRKLEDESTIKMPFSDLSKSGGVVNSYRSALLLGGQSLK
jgi:subtilisin family serine protease